MRGHPRNAGDPTRRGVNRRVSEDSLEKNSKNSSTAERSGAPKSVTSKIDAIFPEKFSIVIVIAIRK